MYHEMVSPGSSSGLLEIYHPLSTSFKNPFLISRSLCVRDRPDDLITAMPWSFWNFLSSSNDSASFSDGFAMIMFFYFFRIKFSKRCCIIFSLFCCVVFSLFCCVVYSVSGKTLKIFSIQVKTALVLLKVHLAI